jgi:biopolymer transport protein ExbD
MMPMIDVVFLLIIFFVLVSQIARAERVSLDLPKLLSPSAGDSEPDREIVVSIIPITDTASSGDWCQVGVRRIAAGEGSVDRLADALGEVLRTDPNVNVTIRAARNESYQRVHPAMEACRRAGVAEAHLVTERRDG